MPDRSRCPNCRERVSPYAAVCGAELDTRRWDSGPSPLNRVGSWLSALTFGAPLGGAIGLIALALLLLYLFA